MPRVLIVIGGGRPKKEKPSSSETDSREWDISFAGLTQWVEAHGRWPNAVAAVKRSPEYVDAFINDSLVGEDVPQARPSPPDPNDLTLSKRSWEAAIQPGVVTFAFLRSQYLILMSA